MVGGSRTLAAKDAQRLAVETSLCAVCPAEWCTHVPGYTYWPAKFSPGYDIGAARANMSAWQLGTLCNSTAGCLGKLTARGWGAVPQHALLCWAMFLAATCSRLAW